MAADSLIINKTNSKNVQDIRKFLSYIQKLNTLKAEPDSEKLYAVKQFLNDKDKIMDCSHKGWLLEKIEELEPKDASKNQRTYKRILIKRNLSPSKIPVN